MASHLSQEEWCDLFERAERSLASSAPKPYRTTPASLDTKAIAASIDHTLLKVDATGSQIDELCKEAIELNFKAVCVRLTWVERAVHNLQGSPVAVACVIGFHEGTHSSEEKAEEAGAAVTAGAKELDMVINHVMLREKRYQNVCNDIAAVRSAAPRPIVLKVILETSVLSRDEVIAGCKIAEAAKADYVKTSTGFNGQGATVENVHMMKGVTEHSMKVKASGGIRSMKEVRAMIEAGADRIGASNGVAIMKEADTQLGATQDEDKDAHGTELHTSASY